MLLFMALAAIILFIALGIYLIASKKQIVVGRIMIILVTAACMFVLTIVGMLILGFSTVHSKFYSIILIIAAILIIAIISCAVCSVFKKKVVFIPLLSGILTCIVTATGFYLYQVYIDNIPTVKENENLLSQYAPYIEKSKAVMLNETANLSLSADFPKMDGATALYPIYSAFAKAVYPKELLSSIAVYEKDNAYLKCSKTTGAYKSIVTGESDIIFVAAPSVQQQEFAKKNGVELVYTPIGKEAFVFFVNVKNPINNISIEEIQKIYTGEITSWEQLGVHGMGAIKAFQRPEDSGSQSALIRLMNGKQLMQPPKNDVVGGMGGIISKTADYKNFKNAVGYSFRFYATEMAANNQIKLLSVNGVYPNIQNIENGTYPITSDFYAVTRKDSTENTKLVLEWIQGEQGQKIIAQTGYTPISKIY